MITISLAPGRAPTASVLAQAADVARRRNAAEACALDFRVYGDGTPEEASIFGLPITAIAHADRCVCSPPCSYDYDPWPYAEAEPDPALYEGTGIAALYGLPGGERHLPRLSGWNVRKESR